MRCGYRKINQNLVGTTNSFFPRRSALVALARRCTPTREIVIILSQKKKFHRAEKKSVVCTRAFSFFSSRLPRFPFCASSAARLFALRPHQHVGPGGSFPFLAVAHERQRHKHGRNGEIRAIECAVRSPRPQKNLIWLLAAKLPSRKALTQAGTTRKDGQQGH